MSYNYNEYINKIDQFKTSNVFTNIDNIIILPDIHGDFEQLVLLLKHHKIINIKNIDNVEHFYLNIDGNNFKNTLVIQLGDQLDGNRGVNYNSFSTKDELVFLLMNKLYIAAEKVNKQYKNYNFHIISLFGNHEFFNLNCYFNYSGHNIFKHLNIINDNDPYYIDFCINHHEYITDNSVNMDYASFNFLYHRFKFVFRNFDDFFKYRFLFVSVNHRFVFCHCGFDEDNIKNVLFNYVNHNLVPSSLFTDLLNDNFDFVNVNDKSFIFLEKLLCFILYTNFFENLNSNKSTFLNYLSKNKDLPIFYNKITDIFYNDFVPFADQIVGNNFLRDHSCESFLESKNSSQFKFNYYILGHDGDVDIRFMKCDNSVVLYSDVFTSRSFDDSLFSYNSDFYDKLKTYNDNNKTDYARYVLIHNANYNNPDFIYYTFKDIVHQPIDYNNMNNYTFIYNNSNNLLSSDLSDSSDSDTSSDEEYDDNDDNDSYYKQHSYQNGGEYYYKKYLKYKNKYFHLLKKS